MHVFSLDVCETSRISRGEIRYSYSIEQLFHTICCMRKISDEELLEKFKSLYPHLSADEVTAAKDALDRYILLAWEIYEDLKQKASLTAPPSGSSIEGKVDSPKNNQLPA
jgi:hypothetical protein